MIKLIAILLSLFSSLEAEGALFDARATLSRDGTGLIYTFRSEQGSCDVTISAAGTVLGIFESVNIFRLDARKISNIRTGSRSKYSVPIKTSVDCAGAQQTRIQRLTVRANSRKGPLNVRGWINLLAAKIGPATGNYRLNEAFPLLTFDKPVDLQNARDNSNRLFVVEQDGVIRTFVNNSSAASSSVFLDIQDRVLSAGGETGDGPLDVDAPAGVERG